MAVELNKEELMENFMNDEELLFESIDLFLERADQRYQLLDEAVKVRDEQRVMEEGHTLKGMVGIFSQGTPFEAAKKLEFMGRNKDLTGVDEALAEFQTLLEDLKNALKEWRNEG